MRVKCQWKYLYRAVDLEGDATNFYLIKTRNHKTAKPFLKRALQSFYILNSFAIKLDKN
ncbi:DDE-type integrase/transposase/recombinase [Priestia megaterium]|uniref:DDE-type integrase/transposase/recombinase n=1 Tax=Priestia megaterium TaxID=1404 RepID=UPI003673249F